MSQARWRNALIGSLVLLATLVVAQRADALYLFYMRKDLAHLIQHDPAAVVGKQVVVTDELSVMWTDVQQRKNRLNGKRYVLFDTELFSCAIPESSLGAHLEPIWEDAKKGYEEITQKIEEVNEQERTRALSASQASEQRRALYWELHRVWSNKPVVTLFGTVERADLWGEVRGKRDGVATERVTIVVDSAEKPRARWYRSLDD